jgi:hypothetical protein
VLALTLFGELKLDHIRPGIPALLEPTTLSEVPDDLIKAGRIDKGTHDLEDLFLAGAAGFADEIKHLPFGA